MDYISGDRIPSLEQHRRRTRALHSRACEVAGGRGARLCAASCGSCEQHRRGPPPTRAAARRARLRLRDPLRGALCVVRISDVLHRSSANSTAVSVRRPQLPLTQR